MAQSKPVQVDPVCGMTVNPETPGTLTQSCDHAQHQTESLLRVYLQHSRRAYRRGRFVSILRHPAEPYDRGRRDELQFSVRDRQRVAPASLEGLILQII